MKTPVMSTHARDRCAEMGISTKVAKTIAMNPSITYAGAPDGLPGSMVCLSDEYPQYAVVTAPGRWEADVTVVITVLFRTPERYTRNGATFEPVGAAKNP